MKKLMRFEISVLVDTTHPKEYHENYILKQLKDRLPNNTSYIGGYQYHIDWKIKNVKKMKNR